MISKGMKMKYSLALALSHHTELIIMDEPTSLLLKLTLLNEGFLYL
jgi:ABC-type multidrug transport system ATPase subunit